jgi:hypothetical protein
MDDLLRSVNNKNFLLLNPAYEKAYPLDQSVRVGKSVYSSNNVKSLFTKFNLKEVPKREIDLNTGRSFSSDESEEDFVDRTKEYKKVKQENYVKKMTQDLDETENNETMYQQDLSEMNTKINSIPLAPRCKNETMGNYNMKYSKFFEEFYIIGVERSNLDCLNSANNIVRPSLLFNYPNSPEHKERHKIIKDF